MSNQELYEKLMAARKRDPKHYGLSRIGAAYEDVRHYARSKSCDRGELRLRVSRLSSQVRRLSALYGLSAEEVRAYFARNRYEMSF